MKAFGNGSGIKMDALELIGVLYLTLSFASFKITFSCSLGSYFALNRSPVILFAGFQNNFIKILFYR